MVGIHNRNKPISKNDDVFFPGSDDSFTGWKIPHLSMNHHRKKDQDYDSYDESKLKIKMRDTKEDKYVYFDEDNNVVYAVIKAEARYVYDFNSRFYVLRFNNSKNFVRRRLFTNKLKANWKAIHKFLDTHSKLDNFGDVDFVVIHNYVLGDYNPAVYRALHKSHFSDVLSKSVNPDGIDDDFDGQLIKVFKEKFSMMENDVCEYDDAISDLPFDHPLRVDLKKKKEEIFMVSAAHEQEYAKALYSIFYAMEYGVKPYGETSSNVSVEEKALNLLTR